MPFGGETAESYYDDGLTSAMRGDLAEAERCFLQALRLDPDYLAAKHQLGKCALRRGDPSEAAARLGEVLQRKPDLVPARLDLGQALLDQDRPEEAQKVFEQVLTHEPENSRALLGMAETAFAQGAWQDAVAYAADSLAHSGPHFPALYLRGKAAMVMGNTELAYRSLDEADAVLETSLEVNPDQVAAHFLRGEVNFSREQFRAAIDHYRDAAELAQFDRGYSAFSVHFTKIDVLARLAVCYQRLGVDDRAMDMAAEILRHEPDHALAKSIREG
jgi:tetratricopeptide (TPR) repeat protein